MMEFNHLRSMLPVGGLGQPLHCFETIGSTNDFAKELAVKGAPHGTLVVADEQTAGRGRGERRWLTSKGGGLALSLILRPDGSEGETIGGVGCLASLAVCEALQEIGIRGEIKWPNDVLIAGRKVAGVLVEVAWEGKELSWIVVGLGVNVRPDSIPPVGEIEYPATSVEAELEHELDRWAFLRTILMNFADVWHHLGSEAITHSIEERLAFRGDDVELVGVGKTVRGRLQGICPDGRLRLLTSKAELEFAAGEIRLRPINANP
jgi:BirA family biotin operon repressor/biotin-[acetyl-CoA-carboxylase] ligase